MVHGWPISSHFLLPDRFFVFSVARSLYPSLGLWMSIEAPLAPVDGTWTGRFQKKPKKRPPANAPRGNAIRGG